jgi:hypothetical protein
LYVDAAPTIARPEAALSTAAARAASLLVSVLATVEREIAIATPQAAALKRDAIITPD